MKFSTSLALISVCTAITDAATIAKPLVESNKLRRSILRSNLKLKAQVLQDIADRNNGTRKWGTSGHWETVHWIYDTMVATDYYDVEYLYFNISESRYKHISVDLDDGTKPVDVRGFDAGTNGTVTGELVYVPNLACNETDFPAEVKGKIAFYQRGTCVQSVKNALALKAGAIGAISYNNDNPPPNPPRLTEPENYNITQFLIAAFIDKETGIKVAEKLQAGAKITATIISDVEQIDYLTANVCAETKGGNHDQVITSGAHSDSVIAGPGINDDGSGTISQLEVAIQLTKFSVNNAVRWCWWSAEEDGLLGSQHYAHHLPQSEIDKIVLNMDFDMLASNNYQYGVYDGDGSVFGKENSGPEGSGLLEQTYIDFFNQSGLPTVPIVFDGRSDYVGFLEIGVPAGGIAMGAEGLKTKEEVALFGGKEGEQYDKCYHEACDRIENLNYDAWSHGTKCVADAIAKYARSIEGFPFPRTRKPAARVKSPYVKDNGSMRVNDRSRSRTNPAEWTEI